MSRTHTRSVRLSQIVTALPLLELPSHSVWSSNNPSHVYRNESLLASAARHEAGMHTYVPVVNYSLTLYPSFSAQTTPHPIPLQPTHIIYMEHSGHMAMNPAPERTTRGNKDDQDRRT